MSTNGLPAAHSARVNRASGMVSVQAKCSIADAVALMQNTADATDVSIEEIADCVLDRSISFET
jgi:AmiR/NasT family two-component response regulator